MFIVYLDEFGHIGPYVSRTDRNYHDSPVFGMAGLILPANEVRKFATWFFQRKCELLDFEIRRDGEHPATWEKKGSALYTTANVTKYRELRSFTNRLLNRIEKCGGHIIYVGVHKEASIKEHKPRLIYLAVLKEIIKRLDQFFELNKSRSNFLIVMDQHQDREILLTEASRAMFGKERPRRRLIEPPFQVESHRYQTVQAADWIAGLIGRLGAFEKCAEDYPDWEWAEKYFGARLRRIRVQGGIRGDKRLQSTSLIKDSSLRPII